MGYHLHLIVLLAKLYRKQLTKVKVAGTLSEWFHVNKGVRQGCVLSPANLRIDDGERTKQTKRIVSAAAILWNAKYFLKILALLLCHHSLPEPVWRRWRTVTL